MLPSKYRINVPQQHRVWVQPDVRVKAIKEISMGYEARFGIKLIYTFMNTDPNFELDYGIIYRAWNDDKTNRIILFDMVPAYSDRCVPAYIYYRKIKCQENFYSYGIEDMRLVSEDKFYQFLDFRCLLNRDKKSDQYWKLPKHSKELCSQLLDAGLPQNRRRVIAEA